MALVKYDPVIHTLLPLTMKGECVDAMEDEMFRLTSKDGNLAVEWTMQLEQDPVQILDAVMPLYLNSRILRALQESLATVD